MDHLLTEKPKPTSNSAHKKALKKRMTIMVITVVIIIGSVLGIHALEKFIIGKMVAKFVSRTVFISASRSKTETWTPMLSAVGSLVAVNGVEVSPEQPGMITEILFNSGEIVAAGQPLIKLDTSTDQEDLKNFEAQLSLAQLKYNQQASLFKSRSTSEISLDEARAQLQQANAAKARTQVIINQKTIKAPFAGKIGIRKANLGQYVSPGNSLVTLQSMNPLYVQFSLPEQNIRHLFVGQPIEVKIDNFPGETFKGKISALDAEVNVKTRNLLIEATLPNDSMKLYPGMFANINVLLPEQKNVVTVPETAVTFSLFGDSIFVIEAAGKDKDGKQILKAKERYISTGERKNNRIAIKTNLKAGEVVVTSGQLKLTDDTEVIINNSVKLPSMSPEAVKKDRS
ncbi:MAG: acriflavin resistance periplasmic protein [Gammaproteobacteria bacterium]|jgi:membrane fusion protein (multidrug efflux system)|nr:acriflavin resistance periplasmic protein [Gammaproteobacteria bacterium]